MTPPFASRAGRGAVPLHLIEPEAWKAWLKSQPAPVRNWVAANGLAGRDGEMAVVPDGEGRLALAVAVTGAESGFWGPAALAARLPAATYRLAAPREPRAATQAAIAWGLGTYRFTRYKANGRPVPVLAWPEGADRPLVEATVEATALVRDLINTPAADMGPAELAEAAQELARAHDARFKAIVGDRLLTENWPLVHAVGRAAARPPRLIDITWGRADAPRVTLVGKGVCFDSGGLDLKPPGGMLTMKKDMGGAAHVLGLASMIMRLRLPVRLRVLIPAVENSVSGDSFRPLDVIRSRQGKTVEIGNTDAEGRLILCDALHEAASEKPALLIDCATLTGAARVALGTEVPALFANDESLAADILRHADALGDPLWRLPLWRPYRRLLDSKVADLSNVASSEFGGAITAALFLQDFVPAGVPWAHIDMMAWNNTDRPGRPAGGEAMGLRALYGMIAGRFARK